MSAERAVVDIPTEKLLDELFDAELRSLEIRTRQALAEGIITLNDLSSFNADGSRCAQKTTRKLSKAVARERSSFGDGRKVTDNHFSEEARSVYQFAKNGHLEPLIHYFDSNLRQKIVNYLHCRYGYSYDRTDDIIQSIWVRVLPRVRNFKVREDENVAVKLKGWFYKIARNLAIDDMRKNHNFMDALEISDDLEENGRAVFGDEEMQRWIDCREVRHAIILLESEAQKEVLMLKYFIGIRTKTIAPIVGKNAGTVRTLLHRGLASVGRILEANKDTANLSRS